MNTKNTTISVDSGNTNTIPVNEQSMYLFYEGIGVGIVLSIVGVLILRRLTRSRPNGGQQTKSMPTPLPPSEPVSSRPDPGNDGKWMRLVQSIVDLGDYVNDMGETVDEDQKGLLKFYYGRLDDVLASNGVTPIKGDKSFSILRHVDELYRDVPDGSIITDTVVQGWIVGDKVLRRAKVHVAE